MTILMIDDWVNNEYGSNEKVDNDDDYQGGNIDGTVNFR